MLPGEPEVIKQHLLQAGAKVVPYAAQALASAGAYTLSLLAFQVHYLRLPCECQLATSHITSN